MVGSCRKRVRAFTLIELLVVLGVIVLLVAIAFPVIGRAVSNAKRTRTQGDMMVIQGALEAYAKDHNGQYPQAEGIDTGFAVLARELVGTYGDGFLSGSTSQTPDDANDPPAYNPSTPYKPGDCVGGLNGPYYVALVEMLPPVPAPAQGEYWGQFNAGSTPRDGVDGPGIKVGNRKVSYIQADKFKVNGCAMLDQDGKPVLYFRGKGNPNIHLPHFYVDSASAAGNPGHPEAKFNVDDNIDFFTRSDDTSLPNARSRVQVMLGDVNNNGGIDPGETESVNGKYILWAPGPDGFYGVKTKVSANPPTPAEISKCDDIILTSP